MISLAWKNIWRNKTRSLIVTIAVTIGIFGGIFFTAFMKGMVQQRIRSAIQNECSNIQIHNPEYLLNKEVKDTILESQSIFAVLDTCSSIKAYAKRIKIIAMVSSAASNQSAILSGINPEDEKKVTKIWSCIADSNGSYFSETKKNQIVIGQKLAQKLKLKLRSKVVLTFSTDSGTIVNAAFRITGIYKTNNSGFDEMHVFVRSTELNKLLGQRSPIYHEIAILLNKEADNIKVSSILSKSFPKSTVRPWSEIMPELAVMDSKGNVMLYILLIIILLALSFGIINTMLMAVLERTREIGMLMAVGMKKLKVFIMILIETICLLFTGTLLGIIISVVLINYLSTRGINLAAFASGLEDVGFSAIVYPLMTFNDYVSVTILVVCAGVLASIVPARRALRLNPATAIRTI